MAKRSVDVLIIGGGPAGLSAGLMLSRTKRTIALFDSGVYRNRFATAMHNVPTFEGRNPADFRNAARQEILNNYGDTFEYVNRRAIKLRKIDPIDGSRHHFEIEDDEHQKWIGRKVILGTGIQDRLPRIPGFESVWGRSAIHCVFCHGTEAYGKPIAVLLDGETGPYINGRILSMFFQRFANLNNEPVTIVANGVFKVGEEPRAAPEYGITEEMIKLVKQRGYRWELRAVTSISEDIPTLSTEHPPSATIHFSDGQSLTVPYILHMPMTEAPPSTLELLSDPSIRALREALTKPNASFKIPVGEIATSTGPFPTTDVPGVFACGNASSFMATVPMSINLGQLAAAGVDQEIGIEDEQDALKAL